MSPREDRRQITRTIFELLFSKLCKKAFPKTGPYGEAIATTSICLKILSLNVRNDSLVDT